MISGPHPEHVKEIWYDEDGVANRVDVNGRTVKRVEEIGFDKYEITNADGNIIRKEYDPSGNLTRLRHEDGSEIVHEYDSQSQLVRTSNERLISTRYEYDAAGAMTSLTDPEGHVTRFTHDIMGNVLTREDPRGNVWTYEYDALGRMTSMTDPLNNITRMEYDPAGKIIRRIDPEGHGTTFEYNQSGDMVKTVDAAGGVTVFDVDKFGNIFRRTDAEGKETWYTHDSMGRMKTTMDGVRNEIKFTYDNGSTSGCSSCSGGYGKVNRITYPTFSREFKYDKRGRKIEEKDVLDNGVAHLMEYKYGIKGDLWWTTDSNSNRTSYLYDDLARLTTVIDAMDGKTSYTYDNRDNLIGLTDANGNTTWFEYDRNDRLAKEIRPMGQETTYAYDGSGNLIEKIDAKGQKTGYVYDAANRLTNVHYYSSGDHANAEKSVSFTYDNAGNLTGYDDGVTTGSYDYDAANRKISETVDYGDFTLTNSYTYYKNGLKKSFTGPEGVTYQYTYDEANRLTSVQIPDVGYITYGDYDWTRPSSIIFPGGTSRNLTYDSLMRVNSIKVKDSSQNELMNYQYIYDKMNNILSKETEHGNYVYGYDDLYRLTSAVNPTLDNEAFAYDRVGNRLTSLDTIESWAYNENNELGGYDDVTYVYDDNGNMTKIISNEVETKYFYDVENRIVRFQKSEKDGSSIVLEDIVSYYYDPFGRRLWKTANLYRTYFHYADEGLVGEYDPNGIEIKIYGYKPGSMWTTDPIYIKIENNYLLYQNDHIGTPKQLLSINGEVEWSVNYTSFGLTDVNNSKTDLTNLRFPGQYFDQETKLHYNYHRYFSPIIGRYLRRDPIGLFGGVNQFIYAVNNPLGNIDFNGLEVVPSPGNDFFEPKPAECTVGCDISVGRVVGFIIWQCCDEKGQMHRHLYSKRCSGPMVGSSITLSHSLFSKSMCKNPPKRAGGAESVGSPGAGVLIGHGGPHDNESVNVGVSVGPKAGNAWCYYEYQSSEKIEGCCD